MSSASNRTVNLCSYSGDGNAEICQMRSAGPSNEQSILSQQNIEAAQKSVDRPY